MSKAFQNNELHIEYFPNGKKQCEGKLLNNKRDGKWTFWDEQGMKIYEGHYKNGLQHLQWTFLDKQGREVTESYDEGKKHGLWRYWDDEGRGVIENHHKDGFKNGLWVYYDDNGNGRIENYINGKKNGSCRYICDEFNIGGYTYKHWDQSQLIDEMLKAIQPDNGVHHKVASLYFENQPYETELEINYLNDKRNGPIILKLSGKVKVEGSYRDDKKHNSWIGFGSNGGLASWIEYWDDEIQSDETERYEKEIEDKKIELENEKLHYEQLEKEKERITKYGLTGESSSTPIYKFDTDFQNHSDSKNDENDVLKNAKPESDMVNVAGVNISKAEYKRLKKQGRILEKEKNIFKRLFGL